MTIFVSAAGEGDGDGSRQRPVVTLARGLELARAAGAKRISIAPGDYYDTAVTLNADDSGLTIEGEGATLYGGVPVDIASREGDLVYCPLAGTAPVRLLLVDGKLARRARFPATGTLQHTTEFAVPWLSTSEGGWQRKPTADELTTMRFDPADLPRSLRAANAEVTVYHMWDESCLPVAAIDFERGVMRFAAPAGHPAGAFGVRKYVVWNTREGLSEPGSFYHDREKGRIVYRLRPGESPQRLIVGTHPSIISLRGAAENPVRDVTLRNLRLRATTAALIPGGFGALAFDGAIDLHGCRGINLVELSIGPCAGYGIRGRDGVPEGKAEGCIVEECGGGGICMRGHGVRLRHNAVRHVGLYFPAGVAIYAGGDDCTIENNQVEDCSYSGIVCTGDRNVIRRNLVAGAMRDLFDGGAIYVTSARENTIEENVCRDIRGEGDYHRVGYYLDERSESTVVRRNIAVNVDVPLQNHMTRSCVLEENVMVNPGNLRIHAARCEDLSMRGNVAWTAGSLIVSGVNAYSTLAGNILFSSSGKYEFIVLDKYRHAGTSDVAPAGIQQVDPGFAGGQTFPAAAGPTDARRFLADMGAFRYREDSPARAQSLPQLNPSLAGAAST